MDPKLVARYQSASGATAYRNKYRGSLSRRLSNRRELSIVSKALVRAGTSGRVLDVPCGAGRLTPTLLRHAEHVTCVDLSASMVDEARDALAAFGDRVDFAVGSADALPFDHDAFDTVVCHRLVHHMETAEERAGVFAELSRVAERAVVCSFSDDSTWKARSQRRRGVKRRRYPLQPAQFFEEVAAHGLTPNGKLLHLNGFCSLVTVAVLHVEGAA